MMEGAATALKSPSPSPKKTTGKGRERPYKGIRMRKWGKWVAEIREPNKRSRIWLGSYATPVAAAKAYDTALYYLRGRAARLNFPDDLSVDALDIDAAMSASLIRKKATEVGARVDAALQLNGAAPVVAVSVVGETGDGRRRKEQEVVKRQYKNPDLNEEPSPESSDEASE